MLSSSCGNTEGCLAVVVNQGASLQSGDGSSRFTFLIRTTRLAVVRDFPPSSVLSQIIHLMLSTLSTLTSDKWIMFLRA